MYYCQVCSPTQWVIFSFCWWFSLLCKTLLVWCSPLCLFFFCFSWGDISEKMSLWEMSEILLHMFCSRIFVVLSLTFKSLIHFEFILRYSIRRWSSFIFFCTYLSNFPNIIYWIDCLYPVVYFCFLCQILIDYKGVSLFLGSLFCSIDLYICFYASTGLFWLLSPYSIVWYQIVWFLQLCSFLRLLWLFRAFFHGFISIFGIFVLVLGNKSFVSRLELFWIYRMLWLLWPF